MVNNLPLVIADIYLACLAIVLILIERAPIVDDDSSIDG